MLDSEMGLTGASGGKNLILGLVSKMSLEQAKPFFLSLEKSGYRGDICMVVSDLDAPTREFLAARSVQMVPFQRAFLRPFLVRLAGIAKVFMTRQQRRLFDMQLGPAYIHPHCARYLYYQSFLLQCGVAYSHVMLTDVVDVLFQNDPFAFAIPDGLSVFMEDSSKKIGTCGFNSRAVLQGFGRAGLKKLAGKPICCSGTIIGAPPIILEHLEHVIRVYFEKKERKSIDQAVHNFIVYEDPPDKLVRFENAEGPVLTMAYVDPARLQFNEQGRILNSSGQIYGTLHQYDRHPELAQKLLKVLT